MHSDEDNFWKVYEKNMTLYLRIHLAGTHASPHNSVHTDINSLRQANQTGLFSHLNPDYNSHDRAGENPFPETEPARGRPVEGG